MLKKAPVKPPVQSQEQQERVTLVEKRAEEGGSSEERLQSYAQLSYYAGDQWIGLARASRSLVPLPREAWEVHYIANRIMPIVRTELAKMTRNKLMQTVVPASSEESDIRSAKTGEKVAEWLEYELKLQEEDQEVIMWALTTRIGFIHPVWDDSKGEVVGKDGKADLHEGLPAVEVLSLFEVAWDTAASRWKDVRWFVIDRMRSCEAVKAKYGIDVPAEDGITVTNIFDGKLSSLTGGGLDSVSSRPENCVRVRECFEFPSSDYPKGRTIICANGVELYADEDIGFGPEDISDRVLPLFPLVHIPVPGKIIGSSVTAQCMPVQREYNKSRSQTIENKNQMANPKWLVEGDNTYGTEITNEPGQVIHYQQGTNPPAMTQPTALGADVDKNIERCLEELQFISSQQEVSHGSTPAGVTSGVAIQFLQEQDDTKLGPSIAQYARFKRAYVSFLLKMIKYKFTEERTIKLVGKNKRMSALTFKGSDLTSFDIRFEDMSATQLTKAGRQQHIMDLVDRQVLNPQMDRDLIIRMLEMNITDELYDGLEIDVNQALMENAQWSKMDFSSITRDFFNHEVHVAQHNKYRKGDEYVDMQPEAQQIIDNHIAEHMNFIMAAMMSQGPVGPAAPGTESGMNMDSVMGALTPEEKMALQQNPQILDKMGGQNNAMV